MCTDKDKVSQSIDVLFSDLQTCRDTLQECAYHFHNAAVIADRMMEITHNIRVTVATMDDESNGDEMVMQ